MSTAGYIHPWSFLLLELLSWREGKKVLVKEVSKRSKGNFEGNGDTPQNHKIIAKTTKKQTNKQINEWINENENENKILLGVYQTPGWKLNKHLQRFGFLMRLKVNFLFLAQSTVFIESSIWLVTLWSMVVAGSCPTNPVIHVWKTGPWFVAKYMYQFVICENM